MQRSNHSILFNLFYSFALLLIAAVFGGLGYLVVNLDFNSISTGKVDPRTIVLVIGGAIGLLAGLTGVFYAIAQLDKEVVETDETDGPANYGAPRISDRKGWN